MFLYYILGIKDENVEEKRANVRSLELKFSGKNRKNKFIVIIISEEKWHLTPVFLLWKFHGVRSPMGHCPWGHKEVGSELSTRTVTYMFTEETLTSYSK